MRPEAFAEPRPQERVQRHTMEQLADVAPMVPSLAVPESQMVDRLVAVIKLVDFVVPEQIIAVPKISWPSRFPRTVLREPQKAELLVEVPVPVPSFSDRVRWEETSWRTGHTWLGGFEWRLIPSRGTTASPGRKINTGQGPRRRPWYHAASVPAVHRQSGGHPCLQLPPQLPTVQTVQYWCFRCRVNCSDKFQQFLVGYGRPCDPAAGVQGRAILGSTVDTYSASVRGWLYGRISHKFYVKVELQILRSILASLPAKHGRRGSGRARRQRQWHVFYWLCWYFCTSRVFPMIAGRLACTRREVCTCFG